MSKTIKDIEAQIKKLEQEKEDLKKKELLEKLEPLKDILSETDLSVAQIKKAIKDAEKELASKKNKKTSSKVKTNKDAEEQVSKPKYVRKIICKECGKEFESHSPRQVVCPECKAKNNK